MKNICKIGSFFLLSFVLFTYACEHEQGVGPPGGGLEPTFSSIQSNILTPKCVNQGCHPGQLAPMSLEAALASSKRPVRFDSPRDSAHHR